LGRDEFGGVEAAQECRCDTEDFHGPAHGVGGEVLVVEPVVKPIGGVVRSGLSGAATASGGGPSRPSRRRSIH
jgi:hypothetical protein